MRIAIPATVAARPSRPRATDLRFLISISGAGISARETTIDQARNEMVANGMQPQVVDQIVELMKLQHDYLRTGEGREQYLARREQLAARTVQDWLARQKLIR